ncbi:DUF3397 domain-containing protein [Neobacillus pocheonensis]|uniref:DUF3397 domain-containing protein n=1 Tax=Neobacillus pocheonensis TaxID=363869 RepID=UPI003D26EA98
MSSIISTVLTFFISLPFFGFLFTLFIFKLVTKNTRKSVHRALDYTTIFFIFSVHFLIITIWGKSLFWLIILIMIVFAMVFVIVHWKVKEEIVLKKVLKGFWRFNFIFFIIIYITLTLYGLIHRAVTFTFSS